MSESENIEAFDPTVDGVLAPGQFLMVGPAGRLMTTLFLSASAFAIYQGQFLPAPLRQLAWLLALFNLAFVPAMFFGPNNGQLYSAVREHSYSPSSDTMLGSHDEDWFDQNGDQD